MAVNDWRANDNGLLFWNCEIYGITIIIYLFKALEVLSKERPQPNIFNTYIIASVLGQALVHLVSFVFIHKEAMIFVEILQEDLPVDGK